jgi:hypothetical protein
MLEHFTHAVFSPHLGKTFRIHVSACPAVDAELSEVTEPKAGRERPFSILFRAPREPLLSQGIYRIEHDEMGAFELFLVPIGPGKDHNDMLYEAVFN